LHVEVFPFCQNLRTDGVSQLYQPIMRRMQAFEMLSTMGMTKEPVT
jgi:hypothetical protein